MTRNKIKETEYWCVIMLCAISTKSACTEDLCFKCSDVSKFYICDSPHNN